MDKQQWQKLSIVARMKTCVQEVTGYTGTECISEATYTFGADKTAVAILASALYRAYVECFGVVVVS